MDTLIVVATMTGTAEMVGEDVQAAIGAERSRMVLAERAQLEDLDGVETLLLVSSTYGKGEVPEPAKPFYAMLEAAARLPALARFGVIGLGDRSLYPETFAQGGQQWDRLLHSRGIVRASAPLLIDCSTCQDLSDTSIAWVKGWLREAMTEGSR
jgi:MioC protein